MNRSSARRTLSLFAGVLLLSSFLSCSRDPKALEAKYQSRGLEALRQGHTSEAVIDFENLIKLSPQSANSHFLLARAFRKKGWIVDAVSEDRMAVNLDPRLAPAHLALAEYGYSTGQLAGSLKEAWTVLALDPENVHARVLVTRLTLFRENPGQARQELHAVLKAYPRLVSATLALADLNLFTHRIDRSRVLYQSVASTLAPQNPDAWIGLGNCALGAGKIPEARTDFEKAHTLDPNSITDTIILGNFEVQQGHVEKAITLLQALSKHHADARVPLKIGEYELLLGKTAEARSALLPLEQAKLDLPELHAALATADLQEHKERDAYDELSDVLARVSGNIRVRTVMARIKQKEGHPRQALALLRSAPAGALFSPEYWILTARLEGQEGHLKKALKMVNTGLSQNPASRLLKVEELQILQALNRWEAGLAASNDFLVQFPLDQVGILAKVFFLERLHRTKEARAFLLAARKQQESNPALELAELQMIGQTEESSGIQQSAQEFLKANPKNVPIRTWLATFDTRTGHPDKARTLWQSLRTDDPGNVPAALALGEEALSRKKAAEAVSLLQPAVAAHPEVERLHLFLGEALAGSSHLKKAAVELESALRILPTDVVAHWDLANIDLSQNRIASARIHLDTVLKTPGLAPPFHARALGLEGFLAAQDGHPEEGVRDLTEASALDPRNPSYPQSLGNLLVDLGRNREAVAAYTKSLKLGLKNTQIRIERDWLRVGASKRLTPQTLAPVLSEVRAYLVRHPQALFARLILFDVDLAQSNLKSAEKELMTLKKTAPENPSVKMAEATLALRTGHLDRANTLLSGVVGKTPANLSALQDLAALAENRHNLPEAKNWLEKIASVNPDDTGSTLSLASIENTLNDYGDARLLLERVLKQHPDLSEARLLLAQTELGMNEVHRAHTLLAALAVQFPKSASIQLLLGESEEKIGQIGKAMQDDRNAITLNPKNPVGYNNLAYLLAQDGAHLNQALQLVRQSRKIEDTPIAMDTEGLVLARMGRYPDAEAVFRQAKNRHFNDPEFLLHMGRNEEKLGFANQALRHFREALHSNLLQEKDRHEVEEQIRFLEKKR